MKTKIKISGQVSGNNILRNAIINEYCEEESLLMYNNIMLTFPTKGHALKALTSARKRLREDSREFDWSKTGIYYDSSNARIIKE